MGSYEGKTAIVLGAAGRDNMGQAIARAFAREGAKVVVAGRHVDELATLAAEIGGKAQQCDIAVKADVEALVDTALEAFGRVDVGINATGYGLLKQFLETTTEELERMCRVQFTGPFQYFQALVRGMRGNAGSIVQISSATATIMLDDHAAYMGTKAGIDQVIRAIANEYGAEGIRANSVAPGLTATPMAAAAYAVPAIEALFNQASPLGRTGRAEDIAEACLWVASDKCFMTGQVLQVNGGVTLRRNPTNAEIKEAAMAGSESQG